MAYAGWYEKVAWSLVYRVEHRKILHSLFVQQLDETPARSAKFVLYGRCHQLSAEASIA